MKAPNYNPLKSFDAKAIVKDLYAKYVLSEGYDIVGLSAQMADDVEWYNLGKPEALKGIDEITEFIDELRTYWRQEAYAIEDYIAEGRKVVVKAYVHLVNRLNHRDYLSPVVTIWEFNEDGKVKSVFELYDTWAVVEASSGTAL